MEKSIIDRIFDSKLSSYERFAFDSPSPLTLQELAILTHQLSSDGDILGEPTPFMRDLFTFIENVPFPSPENPTFTFIDLFAGIGGFRIALQNLGGKCIFSSEFDTDAQKTYFNNYGEIPFGDITLPQVKALIPKHFDILCAGFPCQAFSVAGYRKGFEDTRGTLFFDVATIIREHRPKAFFLENVKNLKSHDSGKTFSIIKGTLEELGYVVFDAILNTMEYANIPQNRERIFIVGFDPLQVENWKEFQFPQKVELNIRINDLIDYTIDDPALFYRENVPFFPLLQEGMTNPNTVYQWRRQYVRENQSNVCPTLTANMGTGGHNVPLIVTPDGFRKLSPRECLNFQGYPQHFNFPAIANSKRYKQVGNSVTVPLIQRIGQQIINIL